MARHRDTAGSKAGRRRLQEEAQLFVTDILFMRGQLVRRLESLLYFDEGHLKVRAADEVDWFSWLQTAQRLESLIEKCLPYCFPKMAVVAYTQDTEEARKLLEEIRDAEDNPEAVEEDMVTARVVNDTEKFLNDLAGVTDGTERRRAERELDRPGEREDEGEGE